MKCLKLKKTEIIIEMQQEDIEEATKLNNNPDEELEFQKWFESGKRRKRQSTRRSVMNDTESQISMNDFYMGGAGHQNSSTTVLQFNIRRRSAVQKPSSA
jgi:hypothetical protein